MNESEVTPGVTFVSKVQSCSIWKANAAKSLDILIWALQNNKKDR